MSVKRIASSVMTIEGSGVPKLRTVEPTSASSDHPSADAETGANTELGANTEAEVTTLAHFAHPRAGTETTLAVLSDPHVSTDGTGTWKVFHRTEARLRAAVVDADDRGVDGVAVAGDLTEDGRPQEFERVADLLADLDAPVVAVPGNHDVPKAFKDHDTPPISEFEERFTPGELPFKTRVGGVDVLGLNSAAAPDGRLDATHDGAISADQLSWLEETLPETDAAFVVSHHNLAGLDACVGGDGYPPHPPVEAADELAAVLADHDALHFSGHVHLPAVTQCEGANGLICPALSSFPQAYALAEIGPTGTTVRMVPVADSEGVTEAYELARSGSERSADVCEMVEAQLADLPLVDER